MGLTKSIPVQTTGIARYKYINAVAHYGRVMSISDHCDRIFSWKGGLGGQSKSCWDQDIEIQFIGGSI